MYDLNQITEETHKISELSRVLSYLIQDRLICDTEITCRLFFEYSDKVSVHMDLGERELYKDLLTSHDQKLVNLASNFMNSTSEIKNIFKQYLRKWCNKKQTTLKIKDHAAFIQETEEMFEMVLKRIQDEHEKLYPALRAIWGMDKAA